MKQFILKENVLTDNILSVAFKGMVFKGGYIAIIKEYTYANAWSDKETFYRFRSKERLFAYLQKNYPETFETFDLSDTCIG